MSVSWRLRYVGGAKRIGSWRITPSLLLEGLFPGKHWRISWLLAIFKARTQLQNGAILSWAIGSPPKKCRSRAWTKGGWGSSWDRPGRSNWYPNLLLICYSIYWWAISAGKVEPSSHSQQPNLQDALRATPYIRPSRWYSWHWSSGVHGEMVCLIPKMEHRSCLSFHGQFLSCKQRLRSKRAGVIIETSWKRIKYPFSHSFSWKAIQRFPPDRSKCPTGGYSPNDGLQQGPNLKHRQIGGLEGSAPTHNVLERPARLGATGSSRKFPGVSVWNLSFTQALGGRLRTHPEMIFSPRNDHIPQVTPMAEENPGACCIKVGSRHPSALHLASHSSLEWQLATSPWALAEWASALPSTPGWWIRPQTPGRLDPRRFNKKVLWLLWMMLLNQWSLNVTTKRWWSLLPETLTLHKCKPHQGAVAGAAGHLTSRPKMWAAGMPLKSCC